MRKLLILGAIVLAAAAASAGWQLGAAYLANVELKSDLKDLSSLAGTRIGLVVPRSSDDIRSQVVAKATERGIRLDPAQVTVVRRGQGDDESISLATEYDAPMNVFGLAWKIHFTAASPHS
jgi:hypothetical protein